MKYNELGATGIKVSHISLGGASFANIYGTFEEDRGIQLIREAFNRGVNYIETGPWYGQGSSETTVGKALQGIPRDSYFIGGKVGRYDKAVERMFDFSAERVTTSIDHSLELLGLDYFDLVQVHDPTFADSSVIIKETLPALERVVRDGKARFIGLADYDLDLMKEIIEESDVKISSILSYAKSTLIDNRLQNYTKYFKSKEVGVINAAATGMGLLSNAGPQSWHPASSETKELCKQAAEYCKSQNVELARLATWYSLSLPDVDTNVCGFFNVQQLLDSLECDANGLSPRDHEVLRHIQERFFNNVTLHWDGVELPAYRAKLSRVLGK